MRLTDFEIAAYGTSNDRSFNGLSRPTVEAVRFELASRKPIEAPFGKLVVSVVPEKRPELLWPFENALGVAQVRVPIAEETVRNAPAHQRAGALLDCVDEALDVIEGHLYWRDERLAQVLSDVRTRDPIGWIELDHLARRDSRTHGWVRFFYEVKPESTAVYAVYFDSDNHETRRELIAASEDAPLYLELFFPVRSAALKGRQIILRDRHGEQLAAVPL